MFKASIGGNAGLARCDAIDSNSVLDRGVACGRKNFVSELLMIKAPIMGCIRALLGPYKGCIRGLLGMFFLKCPIRGV